MRTVLIVGAGFSGTMTAVHLFRRSISGPIGIERIVLLERTGRFTAGVAYGTDHPAHALNVPAGRMSAFDAEPDHFLKWARTRDSRICGGTFVPRRMYGEYIASILRDTESAVIASDGLGGSPSVSIQRVPEHAVQIECGHPAGDGGSNGGRWSVRTDAGSRFDADDVVLAIGNFPPSSPCPIDPALESDGRYAPDPWASHATEVDPEQPVLLIGTGLTMLDIAIALRSKGHSAAVWAISRRGLLPQAHRDSPTPPKSHPRPIDLDNWPRTASGLLKALRHEVDHASEAGVDWREVVTSIRHDTPALWRSLNEQEKRRFLRHLRPFWETHRHRAGPETAARIDRMIGEGQLRVIAGRLESLAADGSNLQVRYRRRGESGSSQSLRVARVINCTGPDTDLARVREPLIVSMRQAGLIRPDALGQGLDSSDSGEVIAADGRVLKGLHVLGPLRKGLLWENTAVPELRGEAERLAERLTRASTRQVEVPQPTDHIGSA
ncbi:MAG: FAD/NAD(P)-binding protein [Phycisphaeraceae bacterium]|nr:FAD/NAD(P)-binding protein [Phycisphaeraceae bacterium]